MINLDDSDEVFGCPNGYYADWDNVNDFSPFIPTTEGIFLDNAPCINSFMNVRFQPQILESPLVQSESNSENTLKFDSDLATVKKLKQASWSKFEDQVLTELYEKYGNKQWLRICDLMNQQFNKQRTPNQCNQRFNRVIRDGLQKGKWTVEEDSLLQQALKDCEKYKWKQIADYVGGRTDTQVRYRIKKQYPEYFSQ